MGKASHHLFFPSTYHTILSISCGHLYFKDRILRNNLKIQQLEQCEAMQNELDAARARINIPREKIRQQFLDEERRRQEELAAAEAALKAEQVGASSNPGATTGAKTRTKSRK